jgi:hypothetical protein
MPSLQLQSYPHFHSYDYYYGLYPLSKKGYSNQLVSQSSSHAPSEEIL